MASLTTFRIYAQLLIVPSKYIADFLRGTYYKFQVPTQGRMGIFHTKLNFFTLTLVKLMFGLMTLAGCGLPDTWTW
jgi:hypothetical protein